MVFRLCPITHGASFGLGETGTSCLLLWRSELSLTAVHGWGALHLQSEDNVANFILGARALLQLVQGPSDEVAVEHEVQQHEEHHDGRNAQRGATDPAVWPDYVAVVVQSCPDCVVRVAMTYTVKQPLYCIVHTQELVYIALVNGLLWGHVQLMRSIYYIDTCCEQVQTVQHSIECT